MSIDFASNAIGKFREYLRIDTTTKHADYAGVVAYLERYASELACEFLVVEMVPGKPICILTFRGTSHANETIMLNSHSDVVPADEQFWSHPPFAAEMDAAGEIYGRGAQDTKQLGIQYLEALRKLQQDGVTLKRTVAVTFVPDEEIGGMDGMCKFVESDVFRSMNVAFCLDEGVASPTRTIGLYDTEKYKMPFRFVIEGVAGHPGLLTPETAPEKLARLLDEIYNLRERERQKIGTVVDGTEIGLRDVITLNVTIVSGGIGDNVVPNRIECLLDCRVPTSVLPADVHQLMGDLVRQAAKRSSCKVVDSADPKAGCGGISIINVREAEFASLNPKLMRMHLPHDSKYRAYLEEACRQFGIGYQWAMFPAQTDARFLRRKGIPVVNVSPLFAVAIAAHQVDEHLHRNLFVDGISFYYHVIQQLANSE